MPEERTTAVVQRYLDDLADDAPTEPVIRALLDRGVRRLQQLCAAFLHRNYPRLTRPPLNLRTDELLGAVVVRLLKALREARPKTARQFFALAGQHMRWELNDLARRLDTQPGAVELVEELVPAAADSGSRLTPDGHQMLEAIGGLPDDEREAFDLVPGRHRPPRSEAVKRVAHGGRHPEGRRLRARAAAGGRDRPHPDRDRAGYTELYGSRAGRGQGDRSRHRR